MRFVITGGTGTGKTALIEELARRGYATIPEGTREYIEEMIELTGKDPRKDRAKFQEYICMVRMNDFLKAEGKKEIYFYDRGHYDEKAYCDHFNSPVPLGYTDFCLNNRYDGLYILPPWPEILQKDTIRTESPQEAIEIHKAIIRTYLEDGYKPIEVPRVGVKERADFVLEHILSK